MHYTQSPITEATIDIWVKPSESFKPLYLEDFRIILGETYPEKQSVSPLPLSVQNSGPDAKVLQSQNGIRFIHSDKRRIVQVWEYGFSFSLLAPYDNWITFRQEAQRLWKLYRNLLHAADIVRFGVRYINRLDIPFSSIELEEYLTTFPAVSDTLPQMLQSYFMQLVLPLPDIKARVIINQGLVPPPVTGVTSLFIDLEIFRDQDVPQEEEELWGDFEMLKQDENRIFESCLTEKTKGLLR